MNKIKVLTIIALLLSFPGSVFSESSPEKNPVKIGLNADMSSTLRRGGESIRRGALIAIEEINEKGGVLGGRPLELIVRNHRGNPSRGRKNIETFYKTDNVHAILGGVHTPVVMSELDLIHEYKIPYLIPWAAGTKITSNGYDPNYVFRVSVRDEYAARFILQQMLEQGYQKIGLLLERTPWGRSNETAFKNALTEKGLSPATVQWFNWSDTDFQQQLISLKSSEAEAVFVVCNALEGIYIVRNMAEFIGKDMAVFSHWGITGGDFYDQAKADLEKINLTFLQTYSFLNNNQSDAKTYVVDAYKRRFLAADANEIMAPAGTAHAYDLIHLYARAVSKAGSTEPEKVREALELINSYSGLVKDYNMPFTEDKHDALDASDFNMAKFNESGAIVPLNRSGKGG